MIDWRLAVFNRALNADELMRLTSIGWQPIVSVK
jgi:hypothetical protein